MTVALRHIGIVTSNIEKSINFYTKILGFKVINDQIERGIFISRLLGFNDTKVEVQTCKMTNGDFTLELLEFANPLPNETKCLINSLGCTHFAITVKDIDGIYLACSSEGASFITPPSLSPDKKVRVAFLKDPNNEIYIEIVEELL